MRGARDADQYLRKAGAAHPRITPYLGCLRVVAVTATRFTVLYDAHYRRVLGYALTKAASGTAEDLVSEMVLVAWRRIDDAPGTWTSWPW